MADAVERASTRLGLHKKKLRSSDIDILRESTLMNLNWPGERFTMQDLLGTAEFVRYIVMDARRGDYGVVACTSQGQWVGTARVLYLPQQNPGYGFVAPGIGELGVSVQPEARCVGLGTELICDVVEIARVRGDRGVSLSVETGNPARKLYEKLGFVDAGGSTGAMLLEF